MFVGHALLAFAIATLVAEWRGWPWHRALAVGVATGAFAAIPDVDVLHAVVALDPGQLLVGNSVRPSEFWGTAHGVHRSMTHSLVAAAIAGPAFGLWAATREELPVDVPSLRRLPAASLAALVICLALVTAGGMVSGLLGVFVVGAFVVAGLVVASVSRRVLELSPRTIGVAAVAGIASHPWGDLFTGQPPHLLYPIEYRLLTERIVLHPDPTLHLLAAFAIELSIVVLAAVVLARQLEYEIPPLVGRRAGLGAGYGIAAVVMVPPTIHLSYHFVFSILAIGLLCGGLRRPRTTHGAVHALRLHVHADPEGALRTVFTGLAGIAVALVSYTVMYLLLV